MCLGMDEWKMKEELVGGGVEIWKVIVTFAGSDAQIIKIVDVPSQFPWE